MLLRAAPRDGTYLGTTCPRLKPYSLAHLIGILYTLRLVYVPSRLNYRLKMQVGVVGHGGHPEDTVS